LNQKEPLVDDARFEGLVEEALSTLSAEIRAHMENVDVIVEYWPDEETLADAGLEGEDPSELLGLYRGVPLTERDSGYVSPPDQILLFQGSILAVAGEDPDAIREEVRVTVLHEIGHFFGMSEERLHQHELD
jgi:predicted Zn-dependent protease with MMP-like domain